MDDEPAPPGVASNLATQSQIVRPATGSMTLEGRTPLGLLMTPVFTLLLAPGARGKREWESATRRSACTRGLRARDRGRFDQLLARRADVELSQALMKLLGHGRSLDDGKVKRIDTMFTGDNPAGHKALDLRVHPRLDAAARSLTTVKRLYHGRAYGR